MFSCMSMAYIMLQDYRYTRSFDRACLKSSRTNLGNSTVIHCWVPKVVNPDKPNLVLLHGLGANAIRQWEDYVLVLGTKFNVYAPNLLFFGESYTVLTERSEAFQAQCVMRTLEDHGVRRMQIVGLSYGGFVGYSMATLFPNAVERLVLVASGVGMEEDDLEKGLFSIKSIDEATSILLPQTPEKVTRLLRQTCCSPPKMYFPCFFHIIIEPTLLIWGESDQMFPPELAHRLKSHLGKNADLVIIKKAGHAIKMEKSKELLKYIKSFLNTAVIY